MKNYYVASILAVSLAGCGGGSSSSSEPTASAQTTAPATQTATPSPVAPGAQTPLAPAATGFVQTQQPAEAKFEWNKLTPAKLVLTDVSGNVLANKTCTSLEPVSLTILEDCTSVTGRRLGTFNVKVSANNITATVALKVIPQRVSLATNNASSFGSGDYNAVVSPQGKVLVWGGNPFGVLGQGKTVVALPSMALPTPVKDTAGAGDLGGIIAASAGEKTVLGLNEDGQVYAWGGGAPLTFNKGAALLPVKVPNAANTSALQHIVAVSVGGDNALGLSDDGTVFSWGNWTGQGGTGGDSAIFPNQVKSPDGRDVLRNIVAVSAGSNYSLALDNTGKVYGWGFNIGGATGVEETQQVVYLPQLVKKLSDATDLTDIVSISAGYNFALALNRDATVYAWGDNSSGQLAQNTQTYTGQNRAVLVKNPAGIDNLTGIASVSAGGRHGLALDLAGNVYSWGSSQNGQLGDGPNHPLVNQSLKPGAVVSEAGTGQLNSIVGLATGYNHSMALVPDGSIYIWGSNFAGNLGQGDANNAGLSYVPLKVKDSNGNATLNISPLSVDRNTYRKYR